MYYVVLYSSFFFFFFNDTATTEIYTLSLHDALPIAWRQRGLPRGEHSRHRANRSVRPPLGRVEQHDPDDVLAEIFGRASVSCLRTKKRELKQGQPDGCPE